MGKGKRMQSAEIDPVGRLKLTIKTHQTEVSCFLLGLNVLHSMTKTSCENNECFLECPIMHRQPRVVVLTVHSRKEKHGNLVDSASSHTLVSKIKPCMSKYKSSTLKLRMAHYISYSLFDSPLLLG